MCENSWVIEVNDKIKRLSDITRDEKKAWGRHSIYKLPSCVTDLITDRNKSVYKPRAVSFGPYHHGNSKFKSMEAHKERALLHFLDRSRKPVECYVEALGDIVQDLKDAYDSLEDYWHQNSEAFLQLMIRDGGFKLEILRTSSNSNHKKDDYASNDPIFSNHCRIYMLPYIKRDMLMLENQLPMLLLRKLHAVYKEHAEVANEESLDNLIVKFYSNRDIPPNLNKCLHVLDVYRTILLWKDSGNQNQKSTGHCKRGDDDDIFSVMELEEAGIRIKKSNTISLKDIKFDCHRGILWLPQIAVDDVSETMFLNLIAFERFHPGAGNEVTDYIYFMDKLIDTSNDVKILQSHEIIQNAFGSDKAVAQLFNSLSKDVVLDPESSLTAVREAINSYCKTDWHKWRATLIQNYFRNPWAIISVIAVIVLFALTIVQAVYGTLQYYQD